MTPQSDQDGFAQFANRIYNWMLVHVGSCWHVGSLVTFGQFPQELRGETRELRRCLEGLEVGSGTDLRPGNM